MQISVKKLKNVPKGCLKKSVKSVSRVFHHHFRYVCIPSAYLHTRTIYMFEEAPSDPGSIGEELENCISLRYKSANLKMQSRFFLANAHITSWIGLHNAKRKVVRLNTQTYSLLLFVFQRCTMYLGGSVIPFSSVA